MAEFIVITGLSGAGRSSVANVLEDLGWFVIDNLPTSLMPKVLELAQAPGSTIERVGFAVGGGAQLGDLGAPLDALRKAGSSVRVVFLDASTEVLVRRYESTRRRHPQAADQRLVEAIERERSLLDPVKADADVVVDTTDLNIHQLRNRITDLFAGDGPTVGMQVTVLSFGFKHGLPVDVDLVIDCRFLPNPYWVDQLRPLTGQDETVRDFVLDRESTSDFLERLGSLLDLLLPAYAAEGKVYLSIALGCTGGRHRSVAIAEELTKRLRAAGLHPRVAHRDITKA